MSHEKYSIISATNHTTYEFFSEGPKGIIKKVILFQEIGKNTFNLAFGDWDKINKTVNDMARSNNGDRDKILSTVAFAVVTFMNHYPSAILIAKGSTPARTRLYQIGIMLNWKDINQLFDLECFLNGSWIPFEKGKNYEQFLLRPK
jgi:hypothetical protein